MKHTEVGDNSLLATIKDLLELGIDDCLKVNVKIRIGILEGGGGNRLFHSTKELGRVASFYGRTYQECTTRC